MTTTRSLPRLLTLGAALVFVAAACGGSKATAGPTGGAGGPGAWVPDAALLATAKTEGLLSPIAEPKDWCNYGALFAEYTAKVGIPVTVISPDIGSGAEIEAIKANPNGGPAAPDVVDVGLAFGPANKDLFLPY